MPTYPQHRPDWQPPFCPNSDCKHHNNLQGDWPFKRHGFFLRRTQPRRIQRFRCKVCGVTFSAQTFAVTYYLKRPDILPRLLTKIVGGMANRQIADDLKTAPATVDDQVDRLGRHCLLLHHRIIADLPQRRDIVVDGFESFELSQYHPFHFHLAVDCDSGLFLSFTDSPLRRKGRMTAQQRRKCQQLEDTFGRPDPQAVRKDMQQLLQRVIRPGSEVTVRSDDHRAYRPAIRSVAARIRHEVTSSRDHRDRHNALYENNLLDLLIRHGQANHKRETIAWAKRRQRSALRLAIFLVWRNYMRMRWRKNCRQTPAMQAGLLPQALSVPDILGRRLFVSQAGLDGRWAEYYRGDVLTPALGVNRRHQRKRAL